jgi:hypothetical protein
MISLHSGRIFDLATNCCGYHVPRRLSTARRRFLY